MSKGISKKDRLRIRWGTLKARKEHQKEWDKKQKEERPDGMPLEVE